MEENYRIFRSEGEQKILDVVCGMGRASIGLAKQLTTEKVVGIDIFRGMRGTSPEPAHRNAKIEGVADKVEFKHGNVLSAPFKSNTFDVVSASSVLPRYMDKRINKKPCGKSTAC